MKRCLRLFLRASVGMCALLVLLCAGLHLRADRVAAAHWRMDPPEIELLADQVARSVRQGIDPSAMGTGSDLFDAEWALVTCQMSVLGLGRIVLEQPQTRARYGPAIERCARWLAQPSSRAFGTMAWGEDAMSAESLASDHGHAYLGWTNTALAVAVRVISDREVHTAHNQLTDALARRLSLPVWRLETYPGEAYPPDMAMVAASVGLSGGHDAELARWSAAFRAAAIDAETGLLRQSLSPRDGAVHDGPRGSGTALAAAFLQYADLALARDLAAAIQQNLAVSTLGCAAVREVPRGAQFRMDIDSGPVIFGRGVSATGFSIAAARVAGDEGWYRGLFRTAHLAGLPRPGSGRWYLAGGSIGNAILLAMYTLGPMPDTSPPSEAP